MLKILKIFAAVVFAAVILTGCTKTDPETGGGEVWDGETDLPNILKNLRTHGIDSWVDVLAIYGADENPMDYKGYDEILNRLEAADNTADMAAYVIVTSISAAIGADPDYFEEYENFKTRLKAVVENSPAGAEINDYTIAFLALMSSAEEFNLSAAREYFETLQDFDDFDTGTAALMIPVYNFLFESEHQSALAEFLNGAQDPESAAWGAVALGDLKSGVSVWIRLYSEMLELK